MATLSEVAQLMAASALMLFVVVVCSAVVYRGLDPMVRFRRRVARLTVAQFDPHQPANQIADIAHHNAKFLPPLTNGETTDFEEYIDKGQLGAAYRLSPFTWYV